MSNGVKFLIDLDSLTTALEQQAIHAGTRSARRR